MKYLCSAPQCQGKVIISCSCTPNKETLLCSNHIEEHLQLKKDHKQSHMFRKVSEYKKTFIRNEIISRKSILKKLTKDILKSSAKIIEKIKALTLECLNKNQRTIDEFNKMLMKLDFGLCEHDYKEFDDIFKESWVLRNRLNYSKISEFESYDAKNYVNLVSSTENQLELFKGSCTGISACINVSSDGKFLVSSNKGGTIQVWDLNSKQMIGSYFGQNSLTNKGIYISNDNKFIISGGFDGHLRIWEISSKKMVYNTILLLTMANIMVMPPDQSHVVYAGTSNLKVFELNSKKTVFEVKLNFCNALAVTSDMNYIIYSDNKNHDLHILDFFNKKESGELIGHTDKCLHIIVSHSNTQTVSCSQDKSIKIWEIVENSLLQSIDLDELPQSLGMSKDDSFIICSFIRYVKLFDFTGQCIKSLNIFSEKLVITPDSKFLYYTCKAKIFAYDINKEKLLDTLSKPIRIGPCVILSKDRIHLIYSSYDNSIHTFNTITKEESEPLIGHSNLVYSMVLSSNNQFLVSGSFDRKIGLWDFSNKSLISMLEGHQSYVWCTAISKCNHYIASTSHDKSFIVWDLHTKTCFFSISGQIFHNITFTDNEKFVITNGWDKRILVWRIEDKTLYKELNGHTSIISLVDTIHKSEFIISASWDGSIRIWNIQSNEIIVIKNQNELKEWVNKCSRFDKFRKFLIN